MQEITITDHARAFVDKMYSSERYHPSSQPYMVNRKVVLDPYGKFFKLLVFHYPYPQRKYLPKRIAPDSPPSLDTLSPRHGSSFRDKESSSVNCSGYRNLSFSIFRNITSSRGTPMALQQVGNIP